MFTLMAYFSLFYFSGASEIVATTAANHATTKVLSQDLSSFEEEFSVFDKNTDSDDENESKMDRKIIKGEYIHLLLLLDKKRLKYEQYLGVLQNIAV